MEKIKTLFYSLVFIALSFPAKAFGQQDLYGSPRSMQVAYGPFPIPGSPDTTSLFERLFFNASDALYLIAVKILLWIVLPVVIIKVLINKFGKRKVKR